MESAPRREARRLAETLARKSGPQGYACPGSAPRREARRYCVEPSGAPLRGRRNGMFSVVPGKAEGAPLYSAYAAIPDNAARGRNGRAGFSDDGSTPVR